MALEKKVKFAVIGCGFIGKRHAEMICRNEESELVALCDIKPKEELGIEKYETNKFNAATNWFLPSSATTDYINSCGFVPASATSTSPFGST